MPGKKHFTGKKHLKILKQKDNLLFHVLLLMSLDSEGNYCIAKKDADVIEEAMHLYEKGYDPENHVNNRRFEDRI
jgi:hypothetical protein